MVKSICPKCSKGGEQHVYSDAKKSPRRYLEYLHKTKSGLKRCYVGRVRTTQEVMGEFEKKANEDESSEALSYISENIRTLIKSYSPTTAVRMHVISKKLIKILEKHGY